MECLLQVRDLKVSYRLAASRRHQAVAGVSFEIRPGEVVGLMGESGCGKTTVAWSLLGLLPRDRVEISGSIIFRGQDLLTMKEPALRKIRGAKISLVCQEPEIALCPVMRVGQQIAEVSRAHREWPMSRARAQAESLLAQVGFSNPDQIARRYPHQLSGGQRQRVLLAQALACQPALIVADEPTAALDARSQSDFLALLRQMKEQTAMLLISHTPEVQASLADRLLIMADGEIIEQGDLRQLYRFPSDRTRALLERHSQPRMARASQSEARVEHQPV
jgi:ABC-type glutathione transport system ATPase component